MRQFKKQQIGHYFQENEVKAPSMSSKATEMGLYS
jgi:hypothetical protein